MKCCVGVLKTDMYELKVIDMSKKEEQAREYAKSRYGNNGNESGNEIAKVQACTVGYIAGWDAAKQELLKEFRDHFCDAYCQYFGNDDYCRCCPIKDENCWLNSDDNNGTTNRSEKPDSSK